MSNTGRLSKNQGKEVRMKDKGEMGSGSEESRRGGRWRGREEAMVGN